MDPEPSCFILLIASTNINIVLGFVLLIVLLIGSALISGAEVALFSLSRTDLEDEELAAKNQIKIITKLLERPKKLLATILVANNFINIGIVILFAFLSEFMFKSITSTLIKFIVDVVVVTFLILLFGEILPKIYASRNNLKFATFMAYPLRVLDVVFSPLSLPMRAITLTIHSRLGKQKSNLSVDQLSQALELTSEHDTTKEEQKILQGIVSFGNTDTKQVMQPRIDVFALSIDQTYAEIVEEIVANGYSRIPVYQDNMDNIKGILYVKDLLPYLNEKEFDWTSLLRDPFFVPENKKLDDLMSEFQEKKVHLAVVVDEYGGTSGLVSLEDIIEEIVGDISDEFDDEDLIFSKLDDKNYVFEGKTALKDFYKIIKLEDDTVFEDNKGEAETLAGFILENSGGFPKRNSKIKFENYVFTIESLDKKRIKRVKVTLP
ncbi:MULTISPECIES: gliding motility-associated protein GldE [Mesoflavibacter]|jgi:gliding motility-associated protein GldE|uniref:Gliding motility-associated protein GldE n=1 Tax=Mesoflavibacter zeaxanthinifaciens subsp. sabulilitoris TaxID=1520893 RepID=A0A2T1N736_9FLAO|nr:MULTISPECIES: gliding motility-associated protein GldE [Mesoflavibacter]MBB3124153.1 gliding motility-associated protein GldE [Mesoflavibacter zeaxanthinifaciens subsp. sabulilitoris]PSG87685.1 gliding motility-associated protein GldE [Mesoflavibacter zeaxanthinifaciens subsp. sabulilitoris]UAB76227.1 gliding motility-associated protein GldE [Mesoflavibacter sp. SCSIO 43206]